MDSEEQTRLAHHQDPELAARVVRTIASIEQDATYAWGPLSERLMTEARAIMTKAAPEPWLVKGDEWSLTLNAANWKATRGVGQDAWIELSDATEDEEDHSWTAVMVSAGKTALCLELKFRKGLVPVAQTLTAKDRAVANVIKEGFQLDASGQRLIVPVVIDAEVMAKGIEQNDLDQAFAPLARAVEIAVTAKPDLDVLVDLVRTKGR